MTGFDHIPRVRLCAMFRASSLVFVLGKNDCNERSLLFFVLRYQGWARPRNGSAMIAQVINQDGDTPSHSTHCCIEYSRDRRCGKIMQRPIAFAKSISWQRYKDP